LPEQAQAGNAIIMIDVDHFKRVNDCYGHLGGDKVLASAAHALQAMLRRTDLIARFGGEEFVISSPAESGRGQGNGGTAALAVGGAGNRRGRCEVQYHHQYWSGLAGLSGPQLG
jgi:GGDEF domain-containing protein